MVLIKVPSGENTCILESATITSLFVAVHSAVIDPNWPGLLPFSPHCLTSLP